MGSVQDMIASDYTIDWFVIVMFSLFPFKTAWYNYITISKEITNKKSNERYYYTVSLKISFRETWYKVVRIIKTEESKIGECEMIFSKKVY